MKNYQEKTSGGGDLLGKPTYQDSLLKFCSKGHAQWWNILKMRV
jgi:hypothetical protein